MAFDMGLRNTTKIMAIYHNYKLFPLAQKTSLPHLKLSTINVA